MPGCTRYGKRPAISGISKGDLRQDLWTLRWSEPLGAPGGGPAIALLPRIQFVSPNPSREALRIGYARRGDRPARLSLHDARGRLVASRSLSEGIHTATARACILR